MTTRPWPTSLAVIWMLLLLAGCSARIVPPPPPEVPRAVFVLDHGRHSSLVLVHGDGSLRRYSYGDWHYYAEGETGLWHGLRAVLVPSQAAFGRRVLSDPGEAGQLDRWVPVVIERLITLQAEAQRVDALIVELESLFHSQADSLHYRAEFDLEFVPHPKAYTLGHNSNRVVADWLEVLGAEVHGTAILSRWRVVE